jgi:hypothetical protein
MGFLKRLLQSSPQRDPRMYPLKVQCDRCGEVLTASVNLANDLSIEYDSSGNPQYYSCRKVIQGGGRCFQQIEVNLQFDTRRSLTDKEIRGGKFVED